MAYLHPLHKSQYFFPLKGPVSDVMYFVSSLLMFAFCRNKPRRNILEGRAMRGTNHSSLYMTRFIVRKEVNGWC